MVACVATSFTFASLAEVLAAAGPVVRSGNALVVVGQWASHPAASATQRRRNPESDRRDETPAALSTRVPRTEAALHTSLHPRMSLQPRSVQSGRGQCNNHPLGRILYTTMMSAAVLARRLTGIC